MVGIGMGDAGVTCIYCGKTIHTLGVALEGLPDTFRVTCPRCGHVATYDKQSIQRFGQFGGPRFAKGSYIPWILIVAIMGGYYLAKRSGLAFGAEYWLLGVGLAALVGCGGYTILHRWKTPSK